MGTLKYKNMSIFCNSNIICAFLVCFLASPAKTNTTITSHEDIIFSCIEDPPSKYFCTNVSVINPSITLHLSKLERKKIYGYVDAFRVMPTITNFTKNIIMSAKVRLSFLGSEQAPKDFIINQRVVRGAQSNDNVSYLIRSDVPSQLPFYTELDDILKKFSYNKIILELVEVQYKN